MLLVLCMQNLEYRNIFWRTSNNNNNSNKLKYQLPPTMLGTQPGCQIIWFLKLDFEFLNKISILSIIQDFMFGRPLVSREL